MSTAPLYLAELAVRLSSLPTTSPHCDSIHGKERIVADEDDSYRDSLFRPDAPVLTRHSGAQRGVDGSFVVDESVPESVRQALQAIEAESRGPQNVEKRWSVRKSESGELEVIGDAPASIRDCVQHLGTPGTKDGALALADEVDHRCCHPRPC